MYSEIPCLRPSDDLFPIRNGKYEVSLGLQKCQGESDLFHVDENHQLYLEEKQKNLSEDKAKYHFYSERFNLIDHQITKKLYSIWNNNESAKLSPNSLFEFSLNIQEDLAIVMLDKNGKDSAEALSLSFPNHWSPASKFQQDFSKVHKPVANIQPLIDIQPKIIKMMFEKGPYKRFAWGLSTDTRLNHHPEAPKLVRNWEGRAFDKDNPRLFMRCERQVVWPFPELKASLFTIKTYFFDINEIKKTNEYKEQLISAIESMNDEALVYKGLENSKDDVLKYIRA